MKLTIIAAMDQELTAVIDSLDCSEEKTHLGFPIYRGMFNGHEITVCQSGIGKVHAGIRAALVIHEYDPNWVINIGSAGGIHPNIEIGDVILGNDISYFDVDVTHFGYQFGQLPAGMPLRYGADNNYNQWLKNAASKESIQLKPGLVVSGDQFIADLRQTHTIQAHFPDAYAVDMESCAIAHTCYLQNKPFSILRAISDHADQKASVSFYDFIDHIGGEYSKIIHRVLIDN